MVEEGSPSTTVAPRRLEIFLDLLLAEATRGTSPLLDPDYEGVLTEEELEIRTLLEALYKGASDAARGSTAWLPIADLLKKLGMRPGS